MKNLYLLPAIAIAHVALWLLFLGCCGLVLCQWVAKKANQLSTNS